MNTAIMFVAASLILVAGIVAVTIPIAVHADKPVVWCFGTVYCGTTHKECMDNPLHQKGEKCEARR